MGIYHSFKNAMGSHQRLHRKAPDSLFQHGKPAVSMDSSGRARAGSRKDGPLCTLSHRAFIAVSLPSGRWHPCHRARCLNLVFSFPWGRPMYYLIFWITFFSSCNTSFSSSLVLPWSVLADCDGSNEKAHWSEVDLSPLASLLWGDKLLSWYSVPSLKLRVSELCSEEILTLFKASPKEDIEN